MLLQFPTLRTRFSYALKNYKPGLKIHGKQLYSTFFLDSGFCSVGKKKACPLGSSRIVRTKSKKIILFSFMMRCLLEAVMGGNLVTHIDG